MDEVSRKTKERAEEIKAKLEILLKAIDKVDEENDTDSSLYCA